MSIKIRTKTNNGITTVNALLRHPMETGRRKDPQTGSIIPIHFIKEVHCQLNGEVVMNVMIGTGISTNPFFSFELAEVKAGDTLSLSWLDNLGNSDQVKVTIT